MNHPTRRLRHVASFAVAAVAATVVACAPARPFEVTTPSGGTASATDGVLVMVPLGGAGPDPLAAGCWATFYEARNFGGDSVTLVGPVALQTLDKGTAKQLKRDIDSLVVGPRANLTVYDKQFLSNRAVGFLPDTREASLIEKLGYGGRIESMRLTCA